MFRRAMLRSVVGVLFVLLCLSFIPLYAQPIGDAQPGDAQPGPGGDTMPSTASTVTGMQISFGREYGKTTIWLRVCADSPHFQLRSEEVGSWQTEVFHRTQKANGCSPSTTSWWRMVYNADPNTGEVFRIYATANDAVLSDAEFMQRAARTDCRVTGYGTGVCTPAAPALVSSPRLSIDEPGGGQTLQGVATVRGWVADAGSLNGPGITDVHVRINDTFIGAASYGEARPDVAAYLGDARFGATGYRIAFDSRSFPNGPATLQVSYRSAITGAWGSGSRQIVIANAPAGPVHTETKLRAITENGKTTVLLQVCGRGTAYRFRSTLASTGQVLFDGTYGAIDGCSPEYRAVINANPGDTLRFFSTTVNDPISDQEFLQRRRDTCRIDAAGSMRCLAGDTVPLPTPANPIQQPPPPVVAPCDVPFFSQYDPRWIRHPLRTGHDPRAPCGPDCGTIGACGCTLTSTAMVLKYYGADTNPARLSDCVGNKACLLDWTAARACSGGKVIGPQSFGFSWSALEQALKTGPVVLGMSKRVAAKTFTHFVVVMSGSGAQPANYVINDPGALYGAKLRLTAYTARGWSLNQIQLYRGTRPTCTAVASVTEAPAAPTASGSGDVYTGGRQQTIVNPSVAATVTGTAVVLSLDETTYTLEIAGQSDGGEITEMRVSSDTRHNTEWQPFTPHVVIQAGDTATVELKDASGNVSAPIVASPQQFQNEPLALETTWSYLPILRR